MGLKAVIVIAGINTASSSGGGTTNITPASGITIYPVDSTLGLTTMNLPATPVANEIAVIVDIGNNASVNNITVNGNGNQIIYSGTGLESSVIIGQNGADFWFYWNGAKWNILA